MDNTGMAQGRVRPIVYFEKENGYIILAPQEVGHDTSLAKKMYEEKYKYQGWRWCETDGSFHAAELLQKRLQEQELQRAREMRDFSMVKYDQEKSRIASNMRQQMQSASCSPWEREFIELWLQLQPEKRREFEQRFTEHNNYLWAIEQDANRKIEERMPSQEGEFWRNDAQQKA